MRCVDRDFGVTLRRFHDQPDLPVTIATVTNRVFIPLSLTARQPAAGAARMLSLSGLTMGTTWSARLICPDALPPATVQQGIQRQLDLVDAQMSTWSDDSDLSRYNQAPAGSWHRMSSHFWRVLDCALSVAALSGGAYDPSVGPLVDLWGFGPAPARHDAPDSASLMQARERCGWTRLRVDRERHAILQPGALSLDFSSIAKGYGVDLATDYLRGLGVHSCLMEAGGELRGIGLKPDGQPWWVGLEQPPSRQTATVRMQNIVALHGIALATSGDYRRCFESAGQRYSHTIDPRTACPVAHRLTSVCVLHADCMTADAWATALMVLGEEEGMSLARRTGLAALFVSRDDDDGLREVMTPDLQAMLA